MLINLTELFTREGKTNDYAVELDCREFQIPQGICPVSDSKPVTFYIENVGDRTLVLSGEAEFTLIDVYKRQELAGVSILGPCRKATQVELSLTDARSIGVAAPIRESGDIAGSGACKLVGPCGEVELKEGVIAAKRHIHATTKDAEALGVTNGEIVSVKVDTEGRSLVFGDVVVQMCIRDRTRTSAPASQRPFVINSLRHTTHKASAKRTGHRCPEAKIYALHLIHHVPFIITIQSPHS